MKKIVEWAKLNPIPAVIITILTVSVLFRPVIGLLFGISSNSYNRSSSSDMMLGNSGFAPALGVSQKGISLESDSYIAPSPLPPNDQAPISDSTNRKIITNSNMSLLVKDVRNTINEIENKAETLNGYFVSKNIRTPTEGGSGSIVLRVPMENRTEMVSFLQNVGVRVLNENVDAQDITDQYEDLDEQLKQLERLKTDIQLIYDQATTVEQLLKVQTQLQNVQRQIDSIKGRKMALDAQSKTTLISVSLSTDELALPYSPSDPWRPNVIVKRAVRSLNGTLRGVGELVIWLGVYSILWVPALIIFKLWRKRRHNKSKTVLS